MSILSPYEWCGQDVDVECDDDGGVLDGTEATCSECGTEHVVSCDSETPAELVAAVCPHGLDFDHPCQGCEEK